MANGLGLGSAGVGAFEGLQEHLARRLQEEAVRAEIERGRALTRLGQQQVGLGQQNVDLSRRGQDLQSQRFAEELAQRQSEAEAQQALAGRRADLNEALGFGQLGLGQGNLQLRGEELEAQRERDRTIQGLREREFALQSQQAPLDAELTAAQTALANARTQGILSPPIEADPVTPADRRFVAGLEGDLSGQGFFGGFDVSEQELMQNIIVSQDPLSKMELLRRRFEGRTIGGQPITEQHLQQMIRDGSFEELFPHLSR